jgi:signal transduction histidine kinase
MFYRANEKSKGSGLGLYIVKEALMKLSGSIQLDSSLGGRYYYHDKAASIALFLEIRNHFVRQITTNNR